MDPLQKWYLCHIQAINLTNVNLKMVALELFIPDFLLPPFFKMTIKFTKWRIPEPVQ